MRSKIVGPALVLFLIAGWNIPATTGKAASPVVTMDPVNLFNTGLNVGWLQIAVDRSVFSDSWSTWASGAAAEFNAAFSHPPVSPPGTTMKGQDASYWFQQIQFTVRDLMGSSRDTCTRMALRIMHAGYYLGRAQIYASMGDCPGCVREEMQKAVLELREISPCIAAGESVAASLLVTARSIGTREPSERFASLYSTLGSAITTIQSGLSRRSSPENRDPGCTSGTYRLRFKNSNCPGADRSSQDTIDLQVSINGAQITMTNPNMRSGVSSASGSIRADGTFAIPVPGTDGRTYTLTGRCLNGTVEVTMPFGDCSITLGGRRLG